MISARLSTVSAALLLPTLALAADFDGSKVLLCAPAEVQECDEVADCTPMTTEAVSLPDFLEIDVGAKRIRAADAPGEYRESAITAVVKSEEGLLLQGAENDMGWTISISADDGAMVLAAAGLEHGFVVFGDCISR